MRVGWLASTGSSSDINTIDARPAASVAALVIAVLAGVALIAILRSRRLSRIEPAGASIELRPETPAVVDLLTGGFEVDDDSVPATVVHLAARRWFSIEEYGDNTIIRTRSSRPPNDSLLPYERRVLDHIERNAIDTTVPTQVLTIGPQGVSDRWFRGYASDVTDHAQRLGLCVDRWTWATRSLSWLLVAVAIAPAWIVADHSDTTDEAHHSGRRPARHAGRCRSGVALDGRARLLSQHRRVHEQVGGLSGDLGPAPRVCDRDGARS
jgi:hypothetical protein